MDYNEIQLILNKSYIIKDKIIELEPKTQAEIMLQLSRNIVVIDNMCVELNEHIQQLDKDINAIRDVEYINTLADKTLTNQQKRDVALNIELKNNEGYQSMFKDYQYANKLNYLLRNRKEYKQSILQTIRLVYKNM